MAHFQQIEFCKKVKELFPDFFRYKLVLDIGSMDINGNNRYLFENSTYLGIDVASGDNVDLVTNGGNLQLPDESVDVIISTECLEHDMFYDKTLANIYRMLKPGGLFFFTCATEGRPEHGTSRTTPQDAPLLQGDHEWKDYYKNLSEADIREIFDIEKQFKTSKFEVNHITHDLYFYGFKIGDLPTNNNKYYSERKLEIALNEKYNELYEKEKSLAEISAQLRQTRLCLSDTTIRLEETLNSKSWRYTKLFRTIDRVARNLKLAIYTRLKPASN